MAGGSAPLTSGKAGAAHPGEAGREKSIRQYLKIYLLGPGGVGDFNVILSLRHSLESEKRKGYLLFLDP